MGAASHAVREDRGAKRRAVGVNDDAGVRAILRASCAEEEQLHIAAAADGVDAAHYGPNTTQIEARRLMSVLRLHRCLWWAE